MFSTKKIYVSKHFSVEIENWLGKVFFQNNKLKFLIVIVILYEWDSNILNRKDLIHPDKYEKIYIFEENYLL